MNDEDIKILEILKETLIKDKFIIPKEPKKWCEAIENLINRNKELEEIEQSHQEENGKLRVELEQEKEKNNELEIELSTRDNINVDKLVEKYKYYRRLADSYQANCISKDKFEFIHINGYLDLYNPGNASIPIKTIDSWRKNVKALCDIATKQEKMIELMAEHISFEKDIRKILCSPKVHGKDDCIGMTCKRCIKQYFEKKAEESE